MQKEKDPHQRFVILIYGAVLSSLIVLALAVQKGQEVYWINGHHTPQSDVFFSTITYLGDGLVFVPLLVILLFVKYRYVLIALSALIIHGIVSQILKRLVFPDSPRPKGLLDNNILYFVPGVTVHEQHSFPSGHTITIFCLATLIALIFKNKFLAIAALLVALFVGYSRIYLLQHFLVDVATGAVAGTAVSFICWYFFEKKQDWMDGRARF